MNTLLTLAKSLGIDPGPLNQADLQEQTCGRAIEGINTLKTEVKMLQNVTEAHQQYIYELAAKVERLRSEFPLFDDDGLDPIEHHCEWALLQERKRLHLLLSEQPPAALEALKALWQEEAEPWNSGCGISPDGGYDCNCGQCG